jgi:hypothetical protein
MKLTIAIVTIVGMSQLALAQSVPSPAQGQHLTKKHRTKIVSTGKPLFTVPVAEKKSTLVTYTPEDMRELYAANHDVEVITLQKSNLIQ